MVKMVRTRMEIIQEILTLCRIPTKRTHLVYQCNLNFKIVKKYLEWVINSDLIFYDEYRKTYMTTERGIEYLKFLNPVLMGEIPTS